MFVQERKTMMTRIRNENLSQDPDELISDRFMGYICDSFRNAPGQIHNETYFVALSRTYLPVFEEARCYRAEKHTNQYIFQHMVRNWYITMRGQVGPESFMRTYMQNHLSLKESPPYFATGMPDTFLSDFSNLQTPPHPLYRLMLGDFFRDCATACEYMRNRIEPCLAIQDRLRAAQALEQRYVGNLDKDSADLVKSFLKMK